MSYKVCRPASADDWSAVREICILTGNNGSPISGKDPAEFAERWIGRYERHLPSWVYVIRNTDSGKVEGYLTGCPDSASLEALSPHPEAFDRVFEKFSGRISPNTMLALYPAHLHVNLLREARGKGGGAMLVSTLLSDLELAGIRGVHLFCGAGPVRFYTSCGFQVLAQTDTSPTVYCLVRETNVKDRGDLG